MHYLKINKNTNWREGMALAQNTTFTKKGLLVLMAILISMIAVLNFVPTASIFAETTQASDGLGINVEMGNDGGLSISGVENNKEGSWNTLFQKYRTVISAILGLAALTMLVFFIMNLVKLGANSGNPQGRSQALFGILWTGLATAILGSLSLVVGLFYNAIK